MKNRRRISCWHSSDGFLSSFALAAVEDALDGREQIHVAVAEFGGDEVTSAAPFPESGLVDTAELHASFWVSHFSFGGSVGRATSCAAFSINCSAKWRRSSPLTSNFTCPPASIILLMSIYKDFKVIQEAVG